MLEKHLLLFTGDNTADLTIYTGALNGEYVLRFCGCPLTSRMIIRETEGHKLDLVVIMWKHLRLDEVRKIADMVRERFPSIPIITVVGPKINRADIREISPDVSICEEPKMDHLRHFADAVHNLAGNHAEREDSALVTA